MLPKISWNTSGKLKLLEVALLPRKVAQNPKSCLPRTIWICLSASVSHIENWTLLLWLSFCFNRGFLHCSLMFWTALSAAAGIRKSTLNGTHLFTLATSTPWAIGIDLDRRNKLIFWVDAARYSVESVDYDGNNRRLLYRHRHSARGYFSFFGIAFLSSYLFVSDYRTHGVFKLNATNGTSTAFISFKGFSTPMGLVPYDRSRQLPGN